jgi:3-oxoadipate enol-lactonase
MFAKCFIGTLFSILFFVSNSSFGAIPKRNSAEENLHYIDTGRVDGTPVLLIHAFPLNQQMWTDQVEFLKNNYRVITFDVRGLGKSELAGPYTLEFVVDDVINLLDKLQIKKVVVCGLSMGGFVALRVIQRNPERIMGLILADTKSEPDTDSSKLKRYEAIKTINQKGLPFYADFFLQPAIAQSAQEGRSKVLARAISIAESNSPNGVSAAALALISRTDTSGDLGKINVPTLILQGEYDAVIPLAAARSLHEKIKNSTFYLIPNAGHLSNLENPTVFNEQLHLFLKNF